MSLILVVDDESDVEMLFRQQFRRELRAGLFRMDFALSADSALQRMSEVAGLRSGPQQHLGVGIHQIVEIVDKRTNLRREIRGQFVGLPGPDVSKSLPKPRHRAKAKPHLNCGCSNECQSQEDKRTG